MALYGAYQAVFSFLGLRVYRSDLHTAIERDTPAHVIEGMLDNGCAVTDLLYTKDTPLHTAAFQGNVPVVRLLLERKADINAVNSYGQSPLDACFKYTALPGNREVALILLQANAKVNVISSENCDKITLLQRVTQNNTSCPEVVEEMLKRGVTVDSPEGLASALYGAVMNGSMDIFEKLVAAKADVNGGVHKKLSPLAAAVCSGNEGAVRLLLQEGADIYSRLEQFDSVPTTALAMACKKPKMLPLFQEVKLKRRVQIREAAPQLVDDVLALISDYDIPSNKVLP